MGEARSLRVCAPARRGRYLRKGAGFFMLTIDKLSVTCRSDLRYILSDFSLQLGPGERAALIGEEGNGKSTLLQPHPRPRPRQRATPSGAAPSPPAGARAICPRSSSPAELDAPARRLFERFARLRGGSRPGSAPPWPPSWGSTPAMFASERPLREFSGGERIKLQLAALAAEEPELYLLDEPSNDLDLASLEWLESFILSRGQPVLFVSHDETLIERTANVIVHLELLRRKMAPRATVARLPYRVYVGVALPRARAAGAGGAQGAGGVRQASLSATARYVRRSRAPRRTLTRQDPHGGRLLKKKMHSVQSMGRRFERERETLTALPETEEAIFLTFPGRGRRYRAASGCWTSCCPGLRGRAAGCSRGT